MAEDEIYQLKRHVERQCGGRATFMRSLPLRETVDGRAWQGIVHVYELAGCRGAIRAYAWFASSVGRHRPYMALHSTQLSSPRKALRETLAADGGVSKPRVLNSAIQPVPVSPFRRFRHSL